jgi:hypothetical protein
MSVRNPRKLLIRVFSLVAFAAFTVSGSLLAQGVTTGAVRGSVMDEAGHPVVGAVVLLTNTTTGLRYRGQSLADGRYNVENVTPGGPFTIEARAVGYRPAREEGFRIALGQVVEINLRVQSAAVELAAVTVTAAADNPFTAKSRTGAATYVTDSFIQRLPTLSRNFTDFIGTSPLVNGGSYPSIAGQNNRYNNIQIDGGVNNDLFGLGSTGTPGGQVSERPISVAAVKEFQILIAPFDVRQGGFTGGLVNAITKSGTNEFHGSAFMYGQNQGLARKVVERGGLTPDTLTKFHEYQYGFTVGGPIIRDRLHFYVAADWKSRSSPFFGTLGGVDSADIAGFGVTKPTADSVAAWASQNLGGAGSSGQVNNDTPDRDFFLKLSGQVTEGSQVELTWNSVKASDGSLIRSSSFSGYRSGYELGNAGYRINNTTNTWRLRYNAALFGRFTNELLLGYSAIRDHRNPGMMTPLIFVGGNATGSAVAIGAERYSQGNVLNQDVYEVSDNLSVGWRSHLFTVGTHNEFFTFHNEFFPGSYGVWAFTNVDSLLAGSPYHYEIALPLRPGGPTADFSVSQYGLYAQDQWTVTPKLTLTYGLRLDAPRMEPAFGGQTPPQYNAQLAAVPFVHVAGDTAIANTAAFSLANLWSPRFGFNYDVNGDQTTLVRGGIGVFSGRPPYVWVSNAYANSGLTQALLSCNASSGNMPAFTTSLAGQPTSCAGGGAPSPPTPSIVYFDHNFKFPQTMRAALGMDKQLPWDMTATVDLLYTRTLNQFYINDVNLRGIVGRSLGEGGRVLYGTIAASNGRTTPTRISSSFADVLRQYNSSGDYSYQGTIQLRKRFSNNLEFAAGYTYSKTYDRMCMTSSISSSNFRYAVLQGPLDNRPLSTSCFDVPNNISFSGIFDIPFGIRASLTYSGQSGRPFTYTVNNDANGDSWGGNDPIYVPINSNDISLSNPADWTRLNDFINHESCLNNARGRLLGRNTCRNPWQSFINATLSKVIPTMSGQNLEISLDVFNLPNLLNSSWGVVHATTGFENYALFQLVGYDTARGRGIYSLYSSGIPGKNAVQLSTRYRLLLSARYTF